jgi:hypothetical protein
VAVLLLSAFVVYAQSQGPTPGPFISSKHIKEKGSKSDKKADSYQRGTEQLPFVIKALPTPKDKDETNYETYERREKPTNERRTLYATVWLAIVTTVLAIFTAYLWLATRKMVKSSEEMAKRHLRAFIFGKGFNCVPDVWDDKIREYVFGVRWENVGLTPGIDVCSWIQLKVRPIDDTEEITFVPSGDRIPTVMGPRSKAETPFLALPLENMIGKWRNEAQIFIWSRVEYRDIFDANIIHHHEQCATVELIHDPSDIPPKGHRSYVSFMVYGPQNSSA